MWSILSATVFFVTILAQHPASYAQQEPIPGLYEPYNKQQGPDPPYPGNRKDPILPTSSDPPAPDDALFQSLAAAEWTILDFYNSALRRFKSEDFTELGFPNDTFDRIQEIRNNEAGHVQITLDMISDASTKPGPCQYNCNISTPMEFITRQTLIEASGPAFLPGLTSQAKEPRSQGVITSLSQIEVRHGTWSTMALFNANPFTGPADTLYPYPMQILSQVAAYIIPGSCPKNNPPFPNPPQRAATMISNPPFPQAGDEVQFVFPVPQQQPKFEEGKEYYVVYFHALGNLTRRFDVESGKSRIPAEFDKGKGVIIAAIADEEGAGREESVVAGPLLMLQQPDLGRVASSGGKM
ncbi:hypothetical protein M409DRAFT_19463 [Zasmidium cellare ATCC 36951]|uniref:Uncharacterized protein n=1 Tax=Zasmidium cellare ATCC 36951 TaxID=1080233 RepID=A0A6A6CWR9_ZASCE|nr:uncharacterized protein M409DRAFT_19463 [Zasmidium cellare ATCC 36951]KAF2170648.1 hypothetical protein M409DRAFT_19463 [Zasmidium cellare ATCC 36951]